MPFPLHNAAVAVAVRETASTPARLHTRIDGDAANTRRCTHPRHEGSRLLDWTRDNFYRYPLKDGEDADKPETCRWGSWCADCRRADSKVKRAARAAATPVDGPRDYSGVRAF